MSEFKYSLTHWLIHKLGIPHWHRSYRGHPFRWDMRKSYRRDYERNH